MRYYRRAARSSIGMKPMGDVCIEMLSARRHNADYSRVKRFIMISAALRVYLQENSGGPRHIHCVVTNSVPPASSEHQASAGSGDISGRIATWRLFSSIRCHCGSHDDADKRHGDDRCHYTASRRDEAVAKSMQ